MYISRRVDIIGPPVWKSTISPCLSKSELASLRLWQSKCQRRMLSPLHCHMLTPPRYPTAPSCTRNPSDIKHDTILHSGLHLGEELRRRLLLNLLPRPLLILQVQSDLALVHCPSINRTNPEGETNKQNKQHVVGGIIIHYRTCLHSLVQRAT